MKTLLVLLVVTVFLVGSAFDAIWTVELTPEALGLWAGTAITLLFSYLPGLNTWYAGKTDAFKRLFMLGVLVVITAMIVLGMCSGLLMVTNLTCHTASIGDLLNILILAIIANQAVFKISPPTQSVREVKATAQG